MINTLQDLLTFEKIYLLSNWGVVPFWLLLIFIPNHVITKFFCHSVIPSLLLTIAYIYVARQIFLEGSILEGFKLYLGLDGLDEIYDSEALRLVFWLHFLAISLFVGSWIARDAQRYMIPKVLTIPSIAATYFAGPVGLIIYWFVRIFYSRKINFDD
jgi:hypothetical protein